MTELPTPIGRQKDVLYLPARGHTVVLGTAGSGKTILAVHRAQYLSNPTTDHHGRTLLVTFNRCLVTYMKRFRGALQDKISIENYHRFARGYLASKGKLPDGSICTPVERNRYIAAVLQKAQHSRAPSPLLTRGGDFFAEEFKWIQQHGIHDAQTYVQAERIGRGTSRVPRSERATLYSLYEDYLHVRHAEGKRFDWEDLASAALLEFQSDVGRRLYRHVVIDEGQDFSPEMVRSLAACIPQDGSLTLFGDTVQQIYGHRMSWRSAGLTNTKVWEFRENYRNTRQVARLALALANAPDFPKPPDMVEPKRPTADGPLPAVISVANEREEISIIERHAMEQAQSGTTAILLKTRAEENLLSAQFRDRATRLHRDLDTWPSSSGLFYGTYHSAKGLEFDTVILPRLSTDRWPSSSDEGTVASEMRLLYVGITRARSSLVLTHAGAITELLPTEERLYQKWPRRDAR